MKLIQLTSLALGSLALVSCVENGGGAVASGGPGGGPGGGGGGGGGVGPLAGCAALNTLDLGPDSLGIVDLDGGNLSPIVTDVFDRYAAVVTPSGERIHLIAEAGVSDAKIRRTREVLRMHLTDVPGTALGTDKAPIANSISSLCGTMALFANASAYDLNDPAIANFDADFQGAYVPLFGNEIVVEGSSDYVQGSPRADSTLGATAVLIHRLGLDIEQPGWTSQINLARLNAEADGTFNPMGFAPYRSLDEAYVAVLLESHSGVWGHDPSGDGSARDGLYSFGSRPDMAAGDTFTLGLLEQFYSPRHDFPAELDPSFSGTFDMLFRESTPYSNRAQYLTTARLTGSNNAELFGNSLDNVLIGNSGNNNLRGRTGDDFLDGGPGLDSAIFLENRDEFTITNNGDGTFTVQHNVTPGLGTDTVTNINILVFRDENVNI